MLVISLVDCLNSWVLKFELRFHGLFGIFLHYVSLLACGAMPDSAVWVQTNFRLCIYDVQSVCVYRVQVAALFLLCLLSCSVSGFK